MRVLVACEHSGVVRDSFIRQGFEAMSCDLLPDESKTEGPHYTGDVLDVLDDGWDLMIAHPPCTYLASSGLHWNRNNPKRQQQTYQAMAFVYKLIEANINHIAIENPVGRISTAYRKPDQYIQPYQFGHDASKKTGLWLRNLPKLIGTSYVEPRIVDGKNRWANQTDSGQNKLGPSPERWKERSKTYEGIAEAMASQWGAFLKEIEANS